MQDGDVIADDCRLADHQPGGVVQEDALADACCGVDIGLENARRPALQIKREILAAFLQQPVGKPMGLDGLETLEIKQRFHEARAGRIAIVNGLDVDAENASPFRPVIQHILEGLTQQHGLYVRMVEKFADTVDHTFFERPVVEDRRIKKG